MHMCVYICMRFNLFDILNNLVKNIQTNFVLLYKKVDF